MSVPPAAAPAAADPLHRQDPSFFARFRRRCGGRGSARALRAAAAAGVDVWAEWLEPRRLFTTIGPNNAFQYHTPDDRFFTIRTGPGVTAELVGATINQAQTAIAIGNLRSVGQGAPNDLYAIYVAQSTANSWITVTADHVLNPQQDPFRGTVSTINIFDNLGRRFVNGAPVIITGGTNIGIGYLGGRIPAIPSPGQDPNAPAPAPFFPQIDQTVPQLGVIPGGANIQAGFYVQDGNDFGRFIFDGVVTGRVDVGGNMDAFYCGWLLTGNSQGIIGPPYTIQRPNTFNVDGDLRNLFSLDSIGTENSAGNGDPRYSSGFDMQVGGRLGSVETRDVFMGKVDVLGTVDPDNPDRPGIRTPDRELEFVQRPGLPNPNPLNDLIPTTDVPTAVFSVRNDTFDRPQILGTHLENIPGQGDQFVASVAGTLQDLGGLGAARDEADYYGLSLMAGQTVVVDLDSALGTGLLDVALIDPDNRIVATDYVLAGVFNAPFGYTADRPGLYRIAVASVGNTTFVPGGGGVVVGTVDYTVTIQRGGDVALGGLEAVDNVVTLESTEIDPNPERPTNLSEASVRVRRGDFGTVLAGAVTIPSYTTTDYAADHGNLRSIEANQIGTLNGNAFTPISIEVPNGSVGLLHSASTDLNAGAGSQLRVITAFDDNLAPIPVGKDMQVISCGGQLWADVRVDGGIGVIRATSIAAQNDFARFFVDFDRNGGGFIDLVDCVTDFGSQTGGGPAFDTGVGGNIRYFQIGGNVFGDTFFTGGALNPTQYGPNEEVNVVDDSGSRITLTPVNNVTPAVTPVSLSVLTYPIRSGGTVLVDVTSTGSVQIKGSGAGVAEVGRVEVRGVGRAVINASDNATPAPPQLSGSRGDPAIDRLVVSPAAGSGELSAIITGGVTVDVLNIVVASSADITQISNATEIRNDTKGGEIVNVTAASVINLFADGPLGLPKNQSGAAIVRYQPLTFSNSLSGTPRPPRPVLLQGGPNIAIGNTYPFVQQTTGIVAVVGNILSISSNMGIGNVLVHGSIGTVTANADHRDDGGAFEGINAPIVAFNFNGSPPDLNGRGGMNAVRLAGRILNVDIGDGILPTGTGSGAQSGLYGDRPISEVVNQGLESDIRGNIVSRADIDHISLNDGAIIGAAIAVVGQFAEAGVLTRAITIPNTLGPINTPILEIGAIDLNGRGGILTSVIAGADIGPITINGGFGFLLSDVITIGATNVDGIRTDGYGIRDSIIQFGAVGGVISAHGDGSSASVLRYTPSVRYAEQAATDPSFLDPFFKVPPSLGTDLYLELGVTPAAPEVAGVTDTGVIQDSMIVGNGNLSSVSSFTIRAIRTGVPILRNPTGLVSGGIFIGDPPSEREFEFMRITAGNSIGTLETRGPINGLFLSSGRIGRFAPGSDLFNTDVQITGPIALFKVNGDFAATSNLVAGGPNGRVKKLQVLGDLIGDVTSTGKIGDILVTGLMDGTITTQVNGGRTQSINSITIGGVTPDGQLNVVGNVGKLTVNGSLGTVGSVNNQVQVTGSAKTIRVNGDLQTNINVTQNLGTLDVRGSIVSSRVTVSDTLKTLKVTGDISDDSSVTARILKKQAIKGNVFGQIIITG